ncbi:HAMP domain-containing histidine kinase [Streptomyces sp. HC44]|uniref:histidine kinase n=1 Tax=Streptomyces scabichelini TaxID=2711217 RepID=A0A6G4VAA0_9ACTN|nr:HAMP domain-containing sensor histidine kinase [Streptomyces scabichelini]NGO10747.1 HAMP domain-containing histidine kinase [Streptomyces scabichelini]
MRRVLGSVRARATLAATLVVAIALVAAGTAVLLSLRSNLTDQTDAQADSAARRVASQLAADIPYAKVEMPDADDERPVQIVEEGGRLVAVSEDLEKVTGTGVEAVRPQGGSGAGGKEEDGDDDRDENDHDPEVGEISDGVVQGSGTATVDGESQEYRFVAVEATTPKDVTYTVYAGAPSSAEESAVSTALTTMLIGLPVLLLTVSGVTWLVTRRALRPVEGIRGEMAAITASEDLARRVPVPDTHDEIARLARTTNETLAALEASVERQRRFVADASHELRSPIASLRTQLEVGVAHPELLDVEGAVEDTVRLQRLAADLLLLARLDAGERPTDARFDLAAFVREEVSQRNGDRPAVSVDAEPVEVAGSRSQLARVLGNLLDNAQRHTRSSVTVTVRREGQQAVLAVDDDGDGVPAAERERVFERFVRLDEARARDDGGAGLGLAIARDVAVRHGGSLTVHEAPAGGARFELRLPLG